MEKQEETHLFEVFVKGRSSGRRGGDVGSSIVLWLFLCAFLYCLCVNFIRICLDSDGFGAKLSVSGSGEGGAQLWNWAVAERSWDYGVHILKTVYSGVSLGMRRRVTEVGEEIRDVWVQAGMDVPWTKTTSFWNQTR